MSPLASSSTSNLTSLPPFLSFLLLLLVSTMASLAISQPIHTQTMTSNQPRNQPHSSVSIKQPGDPSHRNAILKESTATPPTRTPESPTPEPKSPTSKPNSPTPKTKSPTPKPSSKQPDCGGIMVAYHISKMQAIPYPSGQAYSFNATVTMSNVGKQELQGLWSLTLNFTNEVALTSVNGADLPPAATLPLAGNGAVLVSPSGMQFLMSALQAAGDPNRYQHNISLEGTVVGIHSADAALPAGVQLLAHGYQCGPGIQQKVPKALSSKGVAEMQSCCAFLGADAMTGISPPSPVAPAVTQGGQQQQKPGDLGNGVMLEWDVISNTAHTYEVFVRLTNLQRYSNISSDPGWSLSWTWQMGEVILSCSNCQLLLSGDCESRCDACLLDSAIGQKYPPPYNCDSRPTIYDQSKLNGSLAAAAYGTALSSTNFTLVMAKSADFWPGGADSQANATASNNTTTLDHPISASNPSPPLRLPLSFGFSAGTPYEALNTFKNPTASVPNNGNPSAAATLAAANAPQSYSYPCAAPALVQPAPVLQLPSGGSFTNIRSTGAYTILCSSPPPPHPMCCVSASAFFNATLAPCRSCACTCPSPLSPLEMPTSAGGTCDATSAADGDPAAALLLGSSLAGLKPPPGMSPTNENARCSAGCPIQVHLTISAADAKEWVLKGSVLNAGNSTLKDWSMVLSFPPDSGLTLTLIKTAGANVSLDDAPYGNNVLLSGVPTVNDWLLGKGGNIIFALMFNQSLSSAPAPMAAPGLPSSASESPTAAMSAFPTAVMLQGVPCIMPSFFPEMPNHAVRTHRAMGSFSDLWVNGRASGTNWLLLFSSQLPLFLLNGVFLFGAAALGASLII